MKGHEPATISPAGTKTHIMTVALEEYFQGVALAKTIDSRQWPRFETRFEKSTLRRRLLSLFRPRTPWGLVKS